MTSEGEIYLARLVDGEFIELPDSDWHKVCSGEQEFDVFLVSSASDSKRFGGGFIRLEREEVINLVKDVFQIAEREADEEGVDWWRFDFKAGTRWIDDISYSYRVARTN